MVVCFFYQHKVSDMCCHVSIMLLVVIVVLTRSVGVVNGDHGLDGFLLRTRTCTLLRVWEAELALKRF